MTESIWRIKGIVSMLCDDGHLLFSSLLNYESYLCKACDVYNFHNQCFPLKFNKLHVSLIYLGDIKF